MIQVNIKQYSSSLTDVFNSSETGGRTKSGFHGEATNNKSGKNIDYTKFISEIRNAFSYVCIN